MVNGKPVIIVGGGLNGLTMAALLGAHRVPCVVVERHPGTSIQYKFAGISPRSMEIFRGLGIEAEIRANRTGDQQGGGVARGKNLSDPDIAWTGAAWPDASPFSPTQPATCDQHVLEPILRARASSLGADIRFNTELLSLEQDREGVRATIRDLGADTRSKIHGSYLVAADGANGTVRDSLGISRSGPGVLQHWMNIIFDTDLPNTLDGRRFTSCFVSDINGTFTPREGGRWLLALQYDPDKGERPEDFDENKCKELIRKGAGRSDARVDLVDARSWQAAAFVADTFQNRRCFLVGDAAHLMPPPGAFGGNSGIHDAHNLAWKLAHVLRGAAREFLLESYDAERRPVIEATMVQSLARLQRWFQDLGGRLPPPAQMVPDYDVVLGQHYTRGAVRPENAAGGSSFADHRELVGQPGTRVPHFSISRSGKDLSTLDLFGRDCVLLHGPGMDWKSVLEELAEHGFAVSGFQFEIDDHAPGTIPWFERLGVTESGAVLVRPDGFVAWRSDGFSRQSAGSLINALRDFGLVPAGQNQ